MTCALYAPQRPRFEVINISKVLFVIFSFSLSLKRGCIILSPFLAIEVKISQEYSAYNLEASVAETARFILLAATSSIALVIFLVFFTLFILLLISLVPAIFIIPPRLCLSTFLPLLLLYKKFLHSVRCIQ